MLYGIDQQQYLSEVHLHQVPNVDSAKMLNVVKIKINTRAFYAKKNPVCGACACAHKTEKKKDITVYIVFQKNSNNCQMFRNY